MTPEFHFDFGSPNAYLAHKVMPQIAARTGARIAYVPVLLGGVFKLTGNKPPMQAFAGIRNKPEYERLEMTRFIARHGIAFAFNPDFPINTVLIMRGAVAAQEAGLGPAYIDAVFDAMWREPRKMDDPETVATVLAGAGLPARRLLDTAQSQPVKDRLLANTESAVARGVFGSPSFFAGEALFFGKERLGQFEEEILRPQGS